MKELIELIETVKTTVLSGEFVKMTLSKPKDKNSALQNCYLRMIVVKNNPQLSFNYRYHTKDETKNYILEEGYKELSDLLQQTFQNASLFTTGADFLLQTSKKGTVTLLKQKPSFTASADASHDRKKVKHTGESDQYLTLLGVCDEEGKLIPKMADKFRQINKYLEIMEDLVQSVSLPEKIHVVDMGSGKGYLTFALYDFLKNKLSLNVTVTGIELRAELVDYCNNAAKQCGFDQLRFVCQPIEQYQHTHIDILIALHACDTATDDALYKGILSNAALVVCAPCCHKQLRQQVKGIEQESPLLKYGIFKERQFEMITDTIRALIMEQHQYQTKIFEFISNEHTRKNIMLVAAKSQQPSDLPAIGSKIKSIKETYHIDFHYLEKLTK